MVEKCTDRPQSGRFVDGEHRYPVRVHFEDTDFTGLVYHANYLRFMERARSEMLRVAGIEQRAAFEQGEGYYAVAGLDIRFRKPARIDDALLVLSRIALLKAASVVIHQRVMRDGAVLAEAEVQVAFVGADGRPRRQPEAWRTMFGAMNALTDTGA